MYERIKTALLRILRVPAEPHPPAGSPGSVVVFRAARNFYRYRLALWAARQAVAILGFVLFLGVTGLWGEEFLVRQLDRIAERSAERAGSSEKVRWVASGIRQVQRYAGLITTIEVVGFVFLVLQLPVSYALVRLDYEMRWYIATDRSLRLREGVRNVREMTLTYANVQNVKIEQGPLQRLLGIADLVVQTAGGGAGSRDRSEAHADSGGSMHEGRLHGVARAEEIRDLILARLKRRPDAGLGDADEPPVAAASSTLEAAREALVEVRALRAKVEGRAG